MSTHNIRAFFKKAAADRDLRDKVTEIFKGPAVTQPEALSQLSEQVGMPFTIQELINNASKDGQLDEAELEQIAGGAGEAHYEEMWAQDVAAMHSYHSGR